VKLMHETIHIIVLGFFSAIITYKGIRAEFVYIIVIVSLECFGS